MLQNQQLFETDAILGIVSNEEQISRPLSKFAINFKGDCSKI